MCIAFLHSQLPFNPISVAVRLQYLSLCDKPAVMIPTITQRVAQWSVAQQGFFVLAILSVSWTAWRLWRFTLAPMVNKGQVKELPYLVPFLGHGIFFLRDLGGAVKYGREYFGNTRETFSVTVAGQQIYIMTSATNIAATLKSLDTFDYSSLITDIMRKFGISSEAINILHDVPHSLINKPGRVKSLADIGEHSMKQQLNPGPKFDDFEAVLLSEIDARLTWDKLSSKALLSPNTNSPNLKAVSLIELVRQTLVESTAIGFFGTAILQVNPAIVDTFLSFDDRLWMFLYGIPRPWSSGMRAAKEKLHDSVVAYLRLPKDQRPGAAWLASTLETEMSGRGISTRDLAGWLTMIFWSLSTNTWRLCFWVSAYILHDPSLLASIRTEVLPYTSSYSSLSALHTDLSTKCNLFHSVYHETLRLVDSPISIRKITQPVTTAMGESLPPQAFLMLIHRELMLDEKAWGADVRKFNPTRFLRGTAGEAMLRSKSYTPFGGGPMLCPGRFMARGEVMVFVALLISRFDTVPHSPEAQFPRLDTTTGYGSGILGPMKGDDIAINLSCRDLGQGLVQ
ncbi:cytochrome P450 [Stachybotrys elegans]|uniref:Cytochrome P450 n=1 Tax=Stachybotrys elegans TaxID=80388 RepID=A0A8K0WMM7_9HYPO|nr:cytochrome P450 [Stachybotrys elegans]